MFTQNILLSAFKFNCKYNISRINGSLNNYTVKSISTQQLYNYSNNKNCYYSISSNNKSVTSFKTYNCYYKDVRYASSCASNLNTSIDSLNFNDSDKSKYETWLNNGKRFLLPNIDKETNDLINRNIKMDELISSQNQRLLSMCRDYKQYGLEIPASLLKSKYSATNKQGVQDTTIAASTQVEHPCIEGDQDCEIRQKYLRLCRHFEFKNSDQCISNLYEADGNAEILLAQTKVMLDDLVLHCATLPAAATTLTGVQRLKQAIRDYGSVVVVFHVGLSLTSLGICYSAINYGIDLPSIFQKAGLLDESDYQRIAAGASTFVISYAVHKMFAPVRIGITLASVPLIVRKLRNIGFIRMKK